MPDRPRLTPPIADVRRAVRAVLPLVPVGDGPEALVALSGGADSLALAAGVGFESPRAGRRVGAVVVDHALQAGSAAVAATAAAQARGLGLDPVVVLRVEVRKGGGPEAAARTARHDAFRAAMAGTGATRVLTAHTRDDQAETVLLGLARGSGPDSLGGMRVDAPPMLRPLLGLPRAATRAACTDAGLTPWEDPQNADRRYARVRARLDALPALELALGPGIGAALARTADQVQEDADALDVIAAELAPDLAELAEGGVALPVDALAANPTALVHRLIRLAIRHEFGITPTRTQTREVVRLVTDWHGQGALHLPGLTVERRDGRITFRS